MADVSILRRISDVKTFDTRRKTLYTVKPTYGLKDAPRAWRNGLHQVFVDWSSSSQLYTEPEPCCTHKLADHVIAFSSAGQAKLNVLEKAKEHTAKHAESDSNQTLIEAALRQVTCIIAVHVGDLKGAAIVKTAEALLKHFE